MRLIGLTGRSGCGKSTVGKIAQTMKIPVLDCDTIYQEMTSAPSPCLTEIVQTFGDDTVRDGALCRPVLRAKVFSDPRALQALNELTARHMRPEIISRIATMDSDLILLDAPTLFQSGLDAICDQIIGVIASDDVCIGRIVLRDGIDVDAAKKRLDNQFSNQFFIEHCDIILYNENDLATFCDDVCAVLHALINA